MRISPDVVNGEISEIQNAGFWAARIKYKRYPALPEVVVSGSHLTSPYSTCPVFESILHYKHFKTPPDTPRTSNIGRSPALSSASIPGTLPDTDTTDLPGRLP